jgi:hypothetical protein
VTEGLIIDGRRYPVPGVRVVTYLDDPQRCPRVTKGSARLASAATAVMLHTSRGRSGVIVPGSRVSDKAAKLVRYQVRTERKASWCITIGSAGDVWQQCDAATFATWHATVANPWSVGIELAQDRDTPDLTQAQVDACVAVVRVLCEALRIPLQLPAIGGAPVNGVVRAWQSRKQGGDARAVSGVLGHRNVTTSRGKGDPGDGIFRALLAAGFAGVAPDAMTINTLRAPAAVMAPEAPGIDADEEPHDDDAPAWPPLPSWLDPALEVDASEDLPDDLAAFARAQAPVLAALGVTGDRAAELIAHAATECGRGRRAHGHNMGGVKAREREFAEAAAKGTPLTWWRDLGHVESGDDDVVYYRGFADDAAFWAYLMKTRIGRPGVAPTSERYTEASRVFWSADPSGWMLALLLAGYRGDRRKEQAREQGDAHPSVVAHRRLVATVKGILA